MKIIPLNSDTLVKPYRKKDVLSSGIYDPNANIKDSYSYGKVIAIERDDKYHDINVKRIKSVLCVNWNE